MNKTITHFEILINQIDTDIARYSDNLEDIYFTEHSHYFYDAVESLEEARASLQMGVDALYKVHADEC